jgi:serine phosphatase RsbU (regulator of sigma subunit)
MREKTNTPFLSVIRYSIFFWLLIVTISSAFAKKGLLIGVVLNEQNVALEGAMVVIDGDIQTFTDEKGEFSVPYAKKKEPNEVVTFIKGYKEQAWYYNPENNSVKIVMSVGNVLAGRVVKEDGSPLKSTAVLLKGFKTEKKLMTDNDGYFRLLLPKDVTPQNTFTFNIRGKLHNATHYVLNPSLGFYTITFSGIQEEEKKKEVFIQRLVILDNHSLVMSHTPVIIDKVGYVTDAEGKIELKSKVPLNTQFKLNGFSVLHTQVDEENEKLTLVVVPILHKPLVVDTSDEIKDGSLADIDRDFDLILRNLQKENDLVDRNTELISGEVDKIQNRLAKGEKLSPENKKRLQDFLARIQESVTEVYDKETKEYGVRNDELILKLQGLLLEKDSLNKITQARLAKTEAAKAKAEQEYKRKLYLYGIVGAFLAVLAIVGYILALTIRRQKNQLALTNSQLAESKEQINLLYNEQTDSIKTALVIQQSILPPDHLIRDYLPEHFIFYKPKDIVSGDFYWFDVKDGAIYLAVVDCTGHGVSGGFTSMLGYSLLNLSLQNEKNPTPALVLDKLNEGVIRSLRQGTEDSQSKDGMDITLIKWVPGSKKIDIAFGGNPFYIVRNNELLQYKGDKFSIGIPKLRKEIPKFTNFEIEIQSGDMLYIYSDGYADQLGGVDGMQKFMYNQFRELLVSIHNDPMEVQKQKLDAAITNWVGKHEQVDDLTVIGVRIL